MGTECRLEFNKNDASPEVIEYLNVLRQGDFKQHLALQKKTGRKLGKAYKNFFFDNLQDCLDFEAVKTVSDAENTVLVTYDIEVVTEFFFKDVLKWLQFMGVHEAKMTGQTNGHELIFKLDKLGKVIRKVQSPVSKNNPLAKIDTSYWRLDDLDWVKDRENKWQHIEKMLEIDKPLKKCLLPIKDYYLKGKMPNWLALKDWDNFNRHLDIFVFLWLHPSYDEAVLKDLKDKYIASDMIIHRDVAVGYGNFLTSQIWLLTAPYRHIKQFKYPFLDDKGELLFRVLWSDPENTEYVIQGRPTYCEKQTFRIPSLGGLELLVAMAKWLRLKVFLPIHQGFLLQYDEPLQRWYEYVKKLGLAGNDAGWSEDSHPYYERAMYCIHHFDLQKEGDTCRTRLVLKIRMILDKGELIAPLQALWSDVKSGSVQVQDPWNDLS
jgi:hypothetical protein